MIRDADNPSVQARSMNGRAAPAGPVSSQPADSTTGWAQWAALSVYTALIGVGIIPLKPTPAGAAIAAFVAIGAGALLVLPRTQRFMLPITAVAAAGIAVLGNGNSTRLVWFAICLIGIWLALHGQRRDIAIYWAGTVLLFAAEWIWVNADPGWGAWMAGTTLAICAGMLVRRERDLVAQLKEAQAGLTERARAEERNRIARELHDVIAHTLTVSLLHVTSARLAVEHDLEDATRALEEAERLGREALDEVRATVGMLHEDGDSSRTTPLPGADGIPSLVEQFRSAGTDATLTIDGDISRLAATTGLALYRILQEALTNAIKHAPGSPTAVHLVVSGNQAQLTVDTDARPGTGRGFGILNMRERAESVGGTCQAGPGGRGWLVSATFPLDLKRQREGAA